MVFCLGAKERLDPEQMTNLKIMENKQRGLDDKFKEALQSGGDLHPLLKRVQEDHTLMLAIRENCINIYYRGGSILKLTKQGDGYGTKFDEKYIAHSSGEGQPLQIPENLGLANSKGKIKSVGDAQKWVDSFPVLKQIVDIHFAKNPKLEREFQQLVVRENNFSSISTNTDYFITDIELDKRENENISRFDMVAFKYPSVSADRKRDDVQLALIEMKYGVGSLDGDSGVLEHLKQFKILLNDETSVKNLRDSTQNQIQQLYDLGLLKANEHSDGSKRKFVVLDKEIEVIFLFANNIAHSDKLLGILDSDECRKLVYELKAAGHCDVCFYIPNSAGYGLFQEGMVVFDAYIDYLKTRADVD